MMSQRLQSEDEDAESIAEKLDIFPPSHSGYTQKVSGSWRLAVVAHIITGIWCAGSIGCSRQLCSTLFELALTVALWARWHWTSPALYCDAGRVLLCSFAAVSKSCKVHLLE